MNESASLQPLLDALDKPAVCHETDGTIGAINDAAARFLRCRPEDVVGRTWSSAPWNTIDREENGVPEEQLPARRTLATGHSTPATLLGLVPPSGRVEWVNASAVPVPAASGTKELALLLLEPMVAVSAVHPAAAELDRVSQVPPDERQFRKQADTGASHRALFEHSKSVMLIIHPLTGRILDANPSACEFYGYAREELVRMRIQQINTLSEERVRAEMKRAGSRTSGRFRFRHRLASGDIREVEVFSSPIPIGDDVVLHSIVYDVTQREHAERQIRERNWELRLVNSIITASMHGTPPADLLQTVCLEIAEHMDASEALALVLDPKTEGGITVASGCVQRDGSPAVGICLPASSATALCAWLDSNTPSWVRDWRQQPHTTVLADALVTSPEQLLLLPLTGEPRGAFVLAFKEGDAGRDGEAAAALGQRMAAQVSKALAIARIEQTRRRLLAAIEQTSDMVIITEVDGAVVYSNPAYESMTGKAAEWQTGVRFPDAVGAPALHEAWVSAASGMRWASSFSLECADDSRLDVDAVISPVRDDAGDVVNIIGVIRDVTRETQLQQQVQQAQKLEGIGRLAGGLAHDFNNTLAAVMGYAGLVRARLSPDHSAYNDVLEIQETILRASNLSRQLLAFARRQVTEPSPLDLNSVILNLDRMLRRLIGEDIELVTAPASSLNRAVAEAGQIEQVIVNIVVNARDAMPDGGKIVIETDNVFRDASSLAGYTGAEPGDYVHLS
ncbi:MAG: PAS domain-containing sensor histidine kinase, partial [Myxococcota bacterium]